MASDLELSVSSEWESNTDDYFFCRLHDSSGEDIYLAFNAHDYFVKVPLPPPPVKRRWFRVVSLTLYLWRYFAAHFLCYFQIAIITYEITCYIATIFLFCIIVWIFVPRFSMMSIFNSFRYILLLEPYSVVVVIWTINLYMGSLLSSFVGIQAVLNINWMEMWP